MRTPLHSDARISYVVSAPPNDNITSLTIGCSSAHRPSCDGSCWRLFCRPKTISKSTHWAFICANILCKPRHSRRARILTSLNAEQAHMYIPACSEWGRLYTADKACPCKSKRQKRAYRLTRLFGRKKGSRQRGCFATITWSPTPAPAALELHFLWARKPPKSRRKESKTRSRL